jgi:hypothetical protein
MSQRDRTVKTTLLVDDLGEPVPCLELHTTCKSCRTCFAIFDSLLQGQGCKIYPYNDQATVTRPHCRSLTPAPPLTSAKPNCPSSDMTPCSRECADLPCRDGRASLGELSFGHEVSAKR